MHFYCFLCIFPSGSTEGTSFFVSSASSVGFSRRPGRSSDLLPRLFVVVGVALLAILADRKQSKTKNT